MSNDDQRENINRQLAALEHVTIELDKLRICREVFNREVNRREADLIDHAYQTQGASLRRDQYDPSADLIPTRSRGTGLSDSDGSSWSEIPNLRNIIERVSRPTNFNKMFRKWSKMCKAYEQDKMNVSGMPLFFYIMEMVMPGHS